MSDVIAIDWDGNKVYLALWHPLPGEHVEPPSLDYYRGGWVRVNNIRGQVGCSELHALSRWHLSRLPFQPPRDIWSVSGQFPNNR